MLKRKLRSEMWLLNTLQLVLSEESKANSNLMEKYLTLVLQPELLIKIVLKRKRRTEGPKAKIKAAENFYLERRVTDLEVARFEEQGGNTTEKKLAWVLALKMAWDSILILWHV